LSGVFVRLRAPLGFFTFENKPYLKPVSKASIQRLLLKCMICLLMPELLTQIKGFGVVDMSLEKLVGIS
jgi:hypothetical protein